MTVVSLKAFNIYVQFAIYSCHYLTGQVENQYHKMLEDIHHVLSRASAVCTTADLWTSHNRSFFGTTVHWVEISTLKRKSAALACSRFRGRHTFDMIATTLEEIHSKFHLSEKVLGTVTDNGSNFVKAFKMFSEPVTDPTQAVLSHTDDGELTFTNIADILDNQTGGEEAFTLPPHHRCAAHTMNLIAVNDAETGNEDTNYKKLNRSTMAKCSALWNKTSRSPQAAEVVAELCMSEITLTVPNATRWNSLYYAVVKVYSVVEKKSDVVLNDICGRLSLATFRPNEIAFLAEYIKVMQPVAMALDTLQAEDQCFMGILLPTISSLRVRLKSIKASLKFAGPLADALLHGIDKRFGPLETKNDLVIASVSHPQFKLRWIQSDAERVQAKHLLLQAMQLQADVALNTRELHNPNMTPASSENNSFFCFYESNHGINTVHAELDLFLNDATNDISSLQHYPLVKEVFILKNTLLPSSAPVERLFSIGGQILTPRRNCLTDEHFEMLLLLRANKNLS